MPIGGEHMSDEKNAAEAGLLPVQSEEAGMKLLRFLERRLEGKHPGSMLHKWIRTGQVRVNKGRAKPFTLLEKGDIVRVPPFAVSRALESGAPGVASAPALQRDFGPGVRMIGEEDGILALFKPAGLACQGGSGQDDSLAGRLQKTYAGSAFIPAPAHRLDKGSSGVVLAGTAHAAQKRLHALFSRGTVLREYLAWVEGVWEQDVPCLLRDIMRKEADGSGRERMVASPGGTCVSLKTASADDALYSVSVPGTALSLALPVQRLADTGLQAGGSAAKELCGATLMLVRLLTGRTHQIRVQFSSRGHALWGDRRYGGPVCSSMLLHAGAIVLPEPGGPAFFCPPDWDERWMPDSTSLARARLVLDGVHTGRRGATED